jgi:hypothetical protein
MKMGTGAQLQGILHLVVFSLQARCRPSPPDAAGIRLQTLCSGVAATPGARPAARRGPPAAAGHESLGLAVFGGNLGDSEAFKGVRNDTTRRRIT